MAKDKDKKKNKKKDKAKKKLANSDFLKEVKSKTDEMKSKLDKKKADKESAAAEREVEPKKGIDFSQQAEAVKAAVTSAAANVTNAASNTAANVASVASNTAANVANAASNLTREITSKVAKHSTEPTLESFEIPDEETLFKLANLFKIFSDPTRLKILFSLVDGPRCVADISEAAGVTQGATSHQLRSMKQEQLVDFERDGKQVFYSLADNRVQTLLARGLTCIGE